EFLGRLDPAREVLRRVRDAAGEIDPLPQARERRADLAVGRGHLRNLMAGAAAVLPEQELSLLGIAPERRRLLGAGGKQEREKNQGQSHRGTRRTGIASQTIAIRAKPASAAESHDS